MERVILTGGTGFLGSSVLHSLVEDKVEVLAVEHKNPILLNGDFQKLAGGTNAITTKLIDDFKADTIFHCARPTFPRFKSLGRKLAARKAAAINKKLLKQIQNSTQKPKLVFASGSLMYGNGTNPHDENSPLRPISFARQYYKGEQPINKAAINPGPPVLILRFPWLLGEGSWFKWFFLETMRKELAIAGVGSMENKMEIVDVNDAARLMLAYAKSVDRSGIYNIYSKVAITQAAFVDMISSVFNVPIKPYADIFKQTMEKEALEAFNSNILLKSNFNEILKGFNYTELEISLNKIKSKSGIS